MSKVVFAAVLIFVGSVAVAAPGAGCPDSGANASIFDSYLHLIPAPPLEGSNAQLAELKYLSGLTSFRKVAGSAIRCEVKFACLYSRFVPPDSCSECIFTPVIVDMAVRRLDPILHGLKRAYRRPRPSVVAPGIDTLLPVPAHFSYPSGHAAQAMLIALILADLDPVHAETYDKIARSIALNREIAGLHFPSDSIAGFRLARLMFCEIHKAAWYRRLRERAIKEWL